MATERRGLRSQGSRRPCWGRRGAGGALRYLVSGRRACSRCAQGGAGGARAQAGDHVRVTGGQHEGQTGMVVRVEGAACVLVSDAAKAELRVFVRDLSEAASAASGPDTCVPAAAYPRGLHGGASRAWGMAGCLREGSLLEVSHPAVAVEPLRACLPAGASGRRAAPHAKAARTPSGSAPHALGWSITGEAAAQLSSDNGRGFRPAKFRLYLGDTRARAQVRRVRAARPDRAGRPADGGRAGQRGQGHRARAHQPGAAARSQALCCACAPHAHARTAAHGGCTDVRPPVPAP